METIIKVQKNSWLHQGILVYVWGGFDVGRCCKVMVCGVFVSTLQETTHTDKTFLIHTNVGVKNHCRKCRFFSVIGSWAVTGYVVTFPVAVERSGLMTTCQPEQSSLDRGWCNCPVNARQPQHCAYVAQTSKYYSANYIKKAANTILKLHHTKTLVPPTICGRGYWRKRKKRKVPNTIYGRSRITCIQSVQLQTKMLYKIKTIR